MNDPYKTPEADSEEKPRSFSLNVSHLKSVSVSAGTLGGLVIGLITYTVFDATVYSGFRIFDISKANYDDVLLYFFRPTFFVLAIGGTILGFIIGLHFSQKAKSN